LLRFISARRIILSDEILQSQLEASIEYEQVGVHRVHIDCGDRLAGIGIGGHL
jgi:hypothetical protein